MTTLLSRAAQLTAGRCGSGGERDFVAELLWRTPRRLLCGRAQIGHDIPAAAAAGRRTESRCVRSAILGSCRCGSSCVFCVSLHIAVPARRRAPRSVLYVDCMWIVCGLWCRIGRRPFAPARTFEVRDAHTSTDARSVRLIEYIPHCVIRVVKSLRFERARFGIRFRSYHEFEDTHIHTDTARSPGATSTVHRAKVRSGATYARNVRLGTGESCTPNVYTRSRIYSSNNEYDVSYFPALCVM